MNLPILSIEHRGPLPRARILVGGYTKEGARSHAKAISRVLREKLPDEYILPPIYAGFDPETGKHLFRIVVFKLKDEERCKVVLAELALKRSV